MTLKLYLLSILISAIAPYIMPKCRDDLSKPQKGDNRSYTPGKYFENTMELHHQSKAKPSATPDHTDK